MNNLKTTSTTLVASIMSASRSANALGLSSRYLRSGATSCISGQYTRRFISTSAAHRTDLEQTSVSSESPVLLDPLQPTTHKEEQELIKAGKYPISSRRRRAAIQTTPGIPFEQLPYQCFQEARKIIAGHRQEVVKKIEVQRERLGRLEAQDPAVVGGKAKKQHRVNWMRDTLEKLIIEADIHDPRIKMNFEDGFG